MVQEPPRVPGCCVRADRGLRRTARAGPGADAQGDGDRRVRAAAPGDRSDAQRERGGALRALGANVTASGNGEGSSRASTTGFGRKRLVSVCPNLSQRGGVSRVLTIAADE